MAKTKKKTTKKPVKRVARRAKRAQDLYGGWRRAPEPSGEFSAAVVSKAGTNFEGRLQFIEEVRNLLLAYAARFRAAHAETDRAWLAGSSARDTHAVLVGIAARLDRHAKVIYRDSEAFERFVHTMTS